MCIVRPPCPKAGSRPPYDGSHTLESTNRRLEEDQPARSVIVALPPKPRAKRRREARLGLTPRRPHPYPCTNVALAPSQLPRAHFRATGLPKNSASQQPDQPKPPSLPPHPPLRAPPPYRPASRIPLRPLAFQSSQPVRRPGSSPWRQRAPHASTVRRRPPIYHSGCRQRSPQRYRSQATLRCTTHHAAELRAIRRPPPKDRRKIATNRPRPSSWCPITAAALSLPTLALVSQSRLVPPSTLIPALCLMPSPVLRH